MQEALREMEASPTDAFVLELLGHQRRLAAFLLSRTADPERARDLLQEVNLVALKKREDFEPGTHFTAWIFQIARFAIQGARKKHARDRHVFSEAVETMLLERDHPFAGTNDEPVRAALELCLAGLPKEDRLLVSSRYAGSKPLKLLSVETGRSMSSLSRTLARVRAALRECIDQRLAVEAAS